VNQNKQKLKIQKAKCKQTLARLGTITDQNSKFEKKGLIPSPHWGEGRVRGNSWFNHT
jgi:hypothetical protein